VSALAGHREEQQPEPGTELRSEHDGLLIVTGI
jgi:hypothetical protein